MWTKVQRIIQLQNLENQLLDAFIDTKKEIKSHIPTANTPTWVDVLVAKKSKIRLKCGGPVGSKDVILQNDWSVYNDLSNKSKSP